MTALITRNPARPDEVVAEVPRLRGYGVEAVVDAAAQAQRVWEGDAPLRADALHRWAQAIEADAAALARLMSQEVGKPLREAAAEVGRAAAIVRFYSQVVFDSYGEHLPSAPDRHLFVRRRPLGTVLAICPWNFPVAIPVWKLAPALAYGNAAIFKPASAAVGVAQRLYELGRDIFPPGVLAFAPMEAEDVFVLLQDPRISGVSFTGSTEVGRRIIARAADTGTPVQAEMGGQNASIVLDDADLPHAAATIADAAMGYAGQKCTATSRVIVLHAVAETFARLLREAIESLVVGDPSNEHVDVGPVISRGSAEAVSTAVDGALRRGAGLITGGRRLAEAGWYYAPTLVRVDARLDPFVMEETFGPAAALLVAVSDDEAIEIANGTRFGLSGAVFTTDLRRGLGVADRLHAGMIRVNGSTTGADYWAPFGGERASGYGPKEQGRAAREFYTRTQTLTVIGS